MFRNILNLSPYLFIGFIVFLILFSKDPRMHKETVIKSKTIDKTSIICTSQVCFDEDNIAKCIYFGETRRVFVEILKENHQRKIVVHIDGECSR